MSEPPERGSVDEVLEDLDEFLDEVDALLEEQSVLVNYRQRSGQ